VRPTVAADLLTGAAFASGLVLGGEGFYSVSI
jgi:hypothetical protein